MKSTQKKILKMVADGKISPEDADELMGVMGYRTKLKWQYLLNPFDRMPDLWGLFTSILVVILSGITSVLLKVRFDGALDVHSYESVSIEQVVVDQNVTWLGLAVVLWVTSLITAKRGRLIDFLVVVGISRIALLLFGIVIGLVFPDPDVFMRIVTDTPYHPIVILMVVAGMVFLVWFITWLFQGFKTASGLAKGRLVIAFMIAIIVAEVLSKVVLAVAPSIFMKD